MTKFVEFKKPLDFLYNAFEAALQSFNKSEEVEVDANGDVLVSLQLDAQQTVSALGLAGHKEGVAIVGCSSKIADYFDEAFKNASANFSQALTDIDLAAKVYGPKFGLYAVSIRPENQGQQWYLDVVVGDLESLVLQ